jgi:hypothetical protein
LTGSPAGFKVSRIAERNCSEETLRKNRQAFWALDEDNPQKAIG